ncbi:MAG: FAD-dependent oxidoreductase, partial [Gemmatimonadota bacterium]|nr:FAD-dependent oxidoreductase [Gemmatimonadota bacterium]
MPDRETVDALVIGTGQGGKPLAGTLADAGWRTVIVERGRVGGTCVVCGCTPTKTMVASARVAHMARRASDYGVETGPVSVDMETVRARKRDIVDDWSEGSRKGLEKKDGLELVMGEARFAGPHDIDVELEDGDERRFRAERVFINAGARPAVPAIEGLDEVPYLDSTSVMELGRVPDHLIVLGGGFIGLEFGQMFRRFGAEVTLVERGERLASREDEDVSEALRQIFEEDGIRVLTETEATAVREAGAGVRLELEGEGGSRRLEGSHLLVAAG